MFNVYIKHMNKILDCHKIYEVNEDHKLIIFEVYV